MQNLQGRAVGILSSSSTGVSRTGRFGREALEGFVADIFTANKARYGYRRINRELRKTGIVVSDKRVLKVMQSKGLQAKGTTRRWRRAKAVEPGDPRINLVQRVFTVAKRNTLWVGDITYVPTGEGWLYLAAVIDAWSRKVVGRYHVPPGTHGLGHRRHRAGRRTGEPG
jgi:transposase InsO family protein